MKFVFLMFSFAFLAVSYATSVTTPCYSSALKIEHVVIEARPNRTVKHIIEYYSSYREKIVEVTIHDHTPYPANLTILEGRIGSDTAELQIESQLNHGIDTHVIIRYALGRSYNVPTASSDIHVPASADNIESRTITATAEPGNYISFVNIIERGSQHISVKVLEGGVSSENITLLIESKEVNTSIDCSVYFFEEKRRQFMLY